MNQQYLSALAELFKLAAIYGDSSTIGNLCKFLELSLEPVEQLVYWMNNKRLMTWNCDTLTVQTIEEYLAEKVKK